MTAYTLPRIRQPEAVERDERLSPARRLGILVGAIITSWAIFAGIVGALT